MAAFRDVLDDCELSDLGFSDPWYTWERGRLPENNVRERLDSSAANPSWWSLFPGHSVSHQTHTISDHCPLLIDSGGHIFQGHMSSYASFKFDANWILDSKVEQLIKSHFDSSNEDVPNRLFSLGLSLAN
ncbi:hypothetical protein HRI_000101000 [Hibiscus trionum]|uniref:Endonuclease/exonuclease/phosphatase domain-containing protein n=1 Tax=Hibiscus trionum TaxID=183268 RepID=A0A9W7GSM7_HIBTR|nr:hypothetical protein HRI_000101000 [Hibiscus trionum]